MTLRTRSHNPCERFARKKKRKGKMKRYLVAAILCLSIAGCAGFDAIRGADVDLAKAFYEDCVEAVKDAVDAAPDALSKARVAEQGLAVCLNEYGPAVRDRLAE